MRRRRTSVGAAGLAIAAALIIGSTGAAAGGDSWSGSFISSPTDGSTASTPDAALAGMVIYDRFGSPPDTSPTTATTTPSGGYIDAIEVQVRVADGYDAPTGCPGTPASQTFQYAPNEVVQDDGTQRAEFLMSLFFECNGRYVATAVPHLSSGTNGPAIESSFSVAARPPTVEGVSAVRGTGRTVAVGWQPVPSPPADFLGYVVDRKVGEGQWGRQSAVIDGTTWTDSKVPLDGGEISYRVRTARSGPQAPVSGPPSAAATLSIEGIPTTTTTRPSQSGGSRTTRSPGRAPANVQVPTTADTFEEELPYGEGDANAADAQLPEDDLASVLYEDQAARKGFLVPIAGALVLAVWAMHLRYLAKRASEAL